jgi:FtsH-binding integral membrane protein
MLFAGTLVIVVAALVNLFVQMPALSLTIGVLGALIFTAWILYDVSSVVTGAQDNYISAATGLYLDILNLFLSLLRILGVLPFSE